MNRGRCRAGRAAVPCSGSERLSDGAVRQPNARWVRDEARRIRATTAVHVRTEIREGGGLLNDKAFSCVSERTCVGKAP